MKEFLTLLKNSASDRENTLHQMGNQLTMSYGMKRALDIELYKVFSVANTLMDDVTHESFATTVLEQKVQNMSISITKAKSDLLVLEEDNRIVHRLHRCLGQRLLNVEQQLIQQVSTNMHTEQEVLLAQRDIHKIYDQVSHSSKILECRRANVSLEMDVARLLARDLYSLALCHTHVLSAKVPDQQHNVGALQHIYTRKCQRYDSEIFKQRLVFPCIQDVPNSLLADGYWNPTMLDDMDKVVRSLGRYHKLHDQYMYLQAKLDDILSREKLLLYELKASKKRLKHQQKKLRVGMVQEDLLSISAKKSALVTYERVSEVSQKNQNRVTLTVEKNCRMKSLEEREALLQRHKVHLVKALGEIKRVNAKHKACNKRLNMNEGTTRVRDYSRMPRDGPMVSKDLTDSVHAVERKAIGTSVRQLMCRMIIESVGDLIE